MRAQPAPNQVQVELNLQKIQNIVLNCTNISGRDTHVHWLNETDFSPLSAEIRYQYWIRK